jgi:hypothetical protein
VAQELAAMVYNLTRQAQSILEQHENDPPSFSVQLYHDNWTLNSGPKFLYNSPAYTVRSLPSPSALLYPAIHAATFRPCSMT